MERALDPELIRIAVGPHDSLPSPEELSRLLAEAELALLIHNPEVPERLEAIGWYLHAIASSKYALREYGVDRQRKAFQVASHIFDLLLQTPSKGVLERLNYCFAGQIACLRGELDPNATAMYKREFAGKLNSLDLVKDFDTVALSCAVAFLGFDIGYIFRVTARLRNRAVRLSGEWGIEDISNSPFAAAIGVTNGLRDLTSFLIFGKTEALERARSSLKIALFQESSLEDQTSRWVAAHLLNLSYDLQDSSIWTILPSEVPMGVRRSFGLGHPKILTLWPPQVELFKMAGDITGNPFTSSIKREFLSTPTSGGKTLIAQLMIASHLATETTSVCYVAPTRSLCREVRNSLASRLRYVGAEVVDGLPEGAWLDSQQGVAARVEVMTPERLSYLMRSDSVQLLERFGLFIFDEAHLIGDRGRGWILEEDLSYLHYATQGKHHRIILISAAVGNRGHFVQWMSTEDDHGDVIYLHSDWRGPRRLHAICTTRPDWAKGQEESTHSAQFPRRVTYPLYTQLYVRISHTGAMHSLGTIEPVGNLVFKIDLDGIRQKDSTRCTPFYKMLVPIIQHLSTAGPVLVIESTRRDTVLMAKAIAASQPVPNTTTTGNIPLLDLIEARLGEHHPLREVVVKGVAYHHGSLPSEIREAIEEAVADGSIQFLVATTTMTEGVNLPVRSVVVAKQGSYTQEGYKENTLQDQN